MSKVLIEEQTLQDIGNAIRARNGLSTTYKPSEMAGAISELPNVYALDDEGKVVSNGQLVAQGTMDIAEDGTYDTTLYSQVVVAISNPNE